MAPNWSSPKGRLGMTGAGPRREIAASIPERYVLLQQFSPTRQPPQIHHDTTGLEIWDDTEGNRGMCWGGRGHRRHDHRRQAATFKTTLGQPPGVSVAGRTENSPVIRPSHAGGSHLVPGPHKNPGIRRRFRTDNPTSAWWIGLKPSATTRPSEMARRLMR